MIDTITNGKIHISFFEIYNENIIDLLKDGGENENSGKILNGQVKNLIENRIQSIHEFEEIMAKGTSKRMTATTQQNQGSSRSHAVVSVKVKGIHHNKQFGSELILLDLAGSENGNVHAVVNAQRATEMSNINQSVSALRTVIESMKKTQQFTDFRSSKLTQVLQRCFTWQFKTMMIATASLGEKYFSTSKETLSVVTSAMQIKVKD